MNNESAIKNTLSFFEGQGGFPNIKVENQHAYALISLYGAQVLSFKTKPKSDKTKGNTPVEEELLFVSEKAYYESGKAIKGGIPICWPWFGDDPENKGRPAHGFARNTLWSFEETATTANGDTQVTLFLADSEETRRLWPHSFKLKLIINVGKTLRLTLQTHNTGEQPFVITQALHSYFAIADIHQTAVNGLDNVSYIDKTGGSDELVQQIGDVTFNKEVDRIYTDVPTEIMLLDNKAKCQIHIASSGSKTTVIWNPWIKITADMADLQDSDYLRFLCVETANAATDTVNVAAGESYNLSVEYTVS